MFKGGGVREGECVGVSLYVTGSVFVCERVCATVGERVSERVCLTVGERSD